MKKIINVLSLVAAWITAILIVCTVLNEYGFLYVASMFHDSYRPIQIGLAVTMAIIGIRFLLWERGRRKIIYFLVSFCLCFIMLGTMIFIQ